MIPRITTCLLVAFLAVGVAWGASGTTKVGKVETVQVRPDTSSPDAWGYTWVRSNEPGGPTFRWVDITTRGTLVSGLGDDNYVGPFPIQFQFPYYWYTVGSFYVGSNGFICFSSPANFASPFTTLPSTGGTVPKDLLAICTGDLDFTVAASNPRCYYWTNGNDSLVVSFINVTEWQQVANPNLKHTFQVIVNKADSSITYQYGVQQGRYNSTNNTYLCIGWQNQTGQIGTSYTYSSTPPHALMPDSGLAIKIKRTVNTGLQVVDAGVVGGFNTGNLAQVWRMGVADTVKAYVKNFGNVSFTNAVVRYSITRAGQPTANDTVTVASMAAGEQRLVTFPRLFTPAVAGSYSALFNITVTGDIGPGNNSRTTEIASAAFALNQNTRIQFENGTVSGSTSWLGGGGFGVAIDLPPSTYPVRVESVFVQVGPTITTQPMTVEIWSSSGGAPGTVLATRTVNATASALNVIDFRADSAALRITGGRFFVSARGDMQFSYEATAPISLRTWEYTNGWAQYRSADVQDIIMRASVRSLPPAGTTYNVPDVLYLKFNAGTTTTPNYAVPGRGNPVATVTGHTIAPGGQFDSTLLGAEGTGATNWVDNAWAPNLGNGSWTIGFWVSGLHLPSTVGNPCYLFGDVNTASFRCFWAGAGISATDTAILLRKTGQPDMRLVLPNPSLGQASYVHFVYDSVTSTLKGYRNGVLGNTVTWTSPSVTGTGPFKIAGYSTASFSLVTGAKMDEFRIYSRALDTTEIRATWNHTLPYTSSTGVTPISNVIPVGYELAQNYPNPFNPTTTIRFSIPTSTLLSLKVYNILGQEVATLAEGMHVAGTYDVKWDASKFATGVYFYRLQSNNFAQTKKLLLLK